MCFSPARSKTANFLQTVNAWTFTASPELSLIAPTRAGNSEACRDINSPALDGPGAEVRRIYEDRDKQREVSGDGRDAFF
jgi:hypothetical protein